ncbi:hypothetical protein [Streptomyces sp. LN785]|uniref:hypothetical protein n=1 Tax=Streptomyces sp. LN785 TaxID=3112983 RepID=UPI0037208D1C
MNDDHLTPDIARPAVPAVPVEPAVPVVPAEPVGTAPKRRARRVVLAALPFVLVLGAVGGAAGYVKTAVDGADRTVTTRVWDAGSDKPSKDPAGNVGRGKADSELSKLLLPAPDSYRLGPDIDEYGNDTEISGVKATALMKENGRGIAGRQRRELEKRIDKLHIQGIAQRSYTSEDNTLTVGTLIVRMKDKKAVHDMFGFRSELMGAFSGFRKGPKISGHSKAKCFRESVHKEKLDGMSCVAYDGELFITVEAVGSKPFSPDHVAALVKKQLDHIESPGKYI